MIRGFYTALSGLIGQQRNMDTIANNLANISTTAFKPQQTSFSALLYQNINGGDGDKIEMGHGVKVPKLPIDLTAGDLKQTNMPLDYAIVGSGFFAIQDKTTSKITYTRDGSFQLSVNANQAFLINSDGNYVLDKDNKKIEIKDETTLQTVGVFSFKNPYGLELIGGNQFSPTAASGTAVSLNEPNIKSGTLENSSVQLSKEMVKMIEASKGFSLNSKVIQTADELEKIINQLR